MAEALERPVRPTRVNVRRFARIVAGTACIVLGIAGLFLPVLQGVLLLLLGLSLLGKESERVRRWEGWVWERLRARRSSKLRSRDGHR
jgi:uncharacterized membrane protein YbaN (DUF454 family)